MDQGDLPQVAITLVIAFVILFLGTYTVNAVISTGDTGGRVSQAVLLEGTTWNDLGDDVGKNEQVYDSLGYAINTTGASDSEWQSTQDVDIASDDTWTVSLWAAVSPDATSQNMTVLSVSGRILITYNGSASEWRAWYYDDGSTSSYQVNVSAPNQPGTLVQLYVTRNASTLSIYRNTTQGSTADVQNASSVSAPTGNERFDGRTDEVRTFDDHLNSSQRASLHSDPVGALPGTNRTARVMFDQPNKDYQLLFFNPGKIRTSNVTYGDGLNGQVLEGKNVWHDVTGSTDYKWDVVGPRLRPVDGGRLEHAPVAYVAYTQQSQLDTFADDWTSAMGLASVLFVLLPLGVIIVYLQSVRGSR